MKKGYVIIIIFTLLCSTVFAQINSTNITISLTNLNNFGDKLTEKEILINENLAIPIKILFGVKGPIKISFAIMIILIWLMMLIFLRNVLILTPFFKGGISWLMAIVVNLLIALSGGMRFLTKAFLETGSIFKFLEEWTTGALIFSIILAIIIFLILGKAMKFIKRKEEIMKAEEESTKIGVNLGFIGNLRKMFNWGRSISEP